MENTKGFGNKLQIILGDPGQIVGARESLNGRKIWHEEK